MDNERVYAALGLKRRINAAGTLTRLGGALMAPEVVAAMAAAATQSVDIAELQAAASRSIARITGAEAGLVSSGAAAGLTLAAAACMTRWDIGKMAALPHAEGFAHEILMPRTHRTGYAHALSASGARLIDIGHNDRATGAGVRGLEAWEIETAITAGTVAFAFSASPENIADLGTVVSVCKPRGLPVIVDAAAQLPPRLNLRRVIALGADLVVFSGGKAIGGPQASGILAGRRDLIGAALVQQLDMDVAPATWAPPDLIDRAALQGIPHHGLGRGFKVGKEEIVGLLAALERFAAADDTAANALLEERLRRIEAGLGGLPGIGTRLLAASQTGRVPHLHLLIDPEAACVDAIGLSKRLQNAALPVHLSERLVQQGILIVDLQVPPPEDDATIVASLRRALAGVRSPSTDRIAS
ncbi:MAG: aminotransferase class V-fold PLP-dependent enzyme [Betaproteobacteria bacterium]|nr:aminotransferase class V-fold PLP-dependent enzyme [Betaproteobacteria bacterium]